MSVKFTPRGAATCAAIDRTQGAGALLESIGTELSIDGDTVSNYLPDNDAIQCRESAIKIRALVTRAHAAIAEALACAGMFDALSYLPDDVPIYEGAETVQDGPPESATQVSIATRLQSAGAQS